MNLEEKKKIILNSIDRDNLSIEKQQEADSIVIDTFNKLESINTTAIILTNHMAGFTDMTEEEAGVKLSEMLNLMVDLDIGNLVTYIAWYGPNYVKELKAAKEDSKNEE